jgi:preprotein translocase subunit SecY
MPMRVNPAGVLPIIFAQSLIVLPTGALGALAWKFSPESWFHQLLLTFSDLFQMGSFLYVLAYIGLIVFFTYFWTNLMFNPVEIANQMKEYGSFVPGIRPGKRTAEYLEKVMKRITLAGAGFLSLIALVPQFVHQALNVEFLVTSFLGGTGILIVVGVALDLVDKIEAQLLVRHYQGFMRGAAEAPRRGGSEKIPARQEEGF